MTRLRRRHLPGLFLAALLAACAAPPPQATVQVFTPPAQFLPGTTYRYDHLPSQAMRPDQAALEGVADAALARAGLRRDPANARVAIQVTVGQDTMAYAPSWPGSVGVGVGGGSWGGGGVGIGFSFPIGGIAAVYPSLRVDVVVRDQATGQVVYQSLASSNAGASAPMLLAAALRDFPYGPPGVRVVPLMGPAGY